MALLNQVAFAIAALLVIVILCIGLSIAAIVLLVVAFGKDFELDRLIDFLSLTLAAVPILYWVVRRIKARMDTDDRER